MSDIRSFVDTIFDELVSIRRDIHAHPELGMHEVRTSALIRSELEKMGVDEIQQPLPTAVVALIHGKKGPGKCVALRADIDALPVQRIEREKRMDGGKKEEADDPHTSAAKQKRPLRIGAELLLAERPSCSCVAACIRHYFPRQGRRLEPRWRASREFHPSEVLSKLRTGVSL